MSYMSGCIYDGYGYDGGMYVNNIKSVLWNEFCPRV
jgi:hypothetical protein